MDSESHLWKPRSLGLRTVYSPKVRSPGLQPFVLWCLKRPVTPAPSSLKTLESGTPPFSPSDSRAQVSVPSILKIQELGSTLFLLQIPDSSFLLPEFTSQPPNFKDLSGTRSWGGIRGSHAHHHIIVTPICVDMPKLT